MRFDSYCAIVAFAQMQPFGGALGQMPQPPPAPPQQQQQQLSSSSAGAMYGQQQFGMGGFPTQGSAPQQRMASGQKQATPSGAESAPQATPNEQRWQAEAACVTKLRAATASMVKEELQAAVAEAKKLNVGGRELQAAQQLLHEFAEVDQRDQRQRDEAVSKASQEERRKQEAARKQQEEARKKEDAAKAKLEAEEAEQAALQQQADAIIARSRRRAEAMARGEIPAETPPKSSHQTATPVAQREHQQPQAHPQNQPTRDGDQQVRRLSSASETSTSASEAASSYSSSAIPPLSIDRRQALAPKRAAAALRAAQRRGDDGMDHEIIVAFPGREDTPLGIIMCRYSHQFTKARAQIEDEVDD
eukprot:COSAG02_NODE_11178_length_1776_cov_1.573643_1_plen_360_part_01